MVGIKGMTCKKQNRVFMVILSFFLIAGICLSPAEMTFAASAEETAAQNAAAAKTAAYDTYNKLNNEAAALKTEMDNAKEKQTAAENTYNTSKAAVDAKQSDYDIAASRKKKGSYGFYESIGSENAMKALTECKYASYVHMGEETDATSLKNMAATFEWMRYLNNLRKNLGLGELKVTSYLMACAQANCDYSDSVIGHAKQFNVGECLAWNWGSNPYIQWYDNEKKIFDEATQSLGLGSGLTGATAYSCYQSNKSSIDSYVNNHYSGKSVGHYINDINPGYKTTGFAINTKGTQYGVTYGQTFSGYNYNNDPEYTVDEYEKMFNDYKADMEGTISSYEALKAEMDKAASAKQTADTNLKSITDKYNAKTAAAAAALQKYNEAAAAYEKADAAYKAYIAKTGQASSEALIADAKKDTNGKSLYNIISSKGVIYTAPADTTAKVVTIPATVSIDGKKYSVVAVSANAFKDCKNLNKLVIGKNVKTIGENAFLNCSSLKTIIINNTKLTKKSFGKNAFKGINKKAVFKVPKKKLVSYKKWLKNTGITKTMKVKKK